MKAALKLTLAAALVATLTSCTSPQQSSEFFRPTQPAYASAGDSSDVVAFVYGKRTVLEFASSPFFLNVTDEKGRSVDFERDGRFVRLHRQLGAFTASVNGRSIKFTPLPQAKQIAGSMPAIDPIRLDPDATPAEQAAVLATAMAQSKEIKRILAGMKGKKASAKTLERLHARLDMMEAQLGSLAMLQVTFPVRGTEFKPREDLARVLVPAAKAAYAVNLKGRTDAKVAGLDDASIALERALSARKYLVDRGVKAEKIRVSSLAEGDFVAPHWTKEGRARNRRVEVELLAEPVKAVAAL